MREGTIFLPQPVNYFFYRRGIGDMIAAFKVTQTIRKRWPHVRPILWVPDFVKDLGLHMLKDHLEHVSVMGWSEKEKHWDQNFPSKTFSKGGLNTWRIPLMIQNFLWMTDYFPSGDELDYPLFDASGIDISGFDLPQNFVVIASTHNAGNKFFLPRHIRKIIKWLRAKDITPVLMGNTNQKYMHLGKEESTRYAGVKEIKGALSLVDKTTLTQAGAILAKAKAVIGIDGGLLHLAACTDVPIVCGFTVVRPELFTPTRNGVFGRDYYTVHPEQSLGCRFCHSQINFINHGDVSTCFYKDNKCLDQMDGYKFINQLEKIL